jgi:hypothetical protein
MRSGKRDCVVYVGELPEDVREREIEDLFWDVCAFYFRFGCFVSDYSEVPSISTVLDLPIVLRLKRDSMTITIRLVSTCSPQFPLLRCKLLLQQFGQQLARGPPP